MSIIKRMMNDLNRVVTAPTTVILKSTHESSELSIPHTWVERAVTYYLGHRQIHELGERALVFAGVPIVPVYLDDYYGVAYEYRS